MTERLAECPLLSCPDLWLAVLAGACLFVVGAAFWRPRT